MSNKFFYPLIFFGTFLLDRLTKLWALTVLSSHPVPIFPGFNLQLAWNRGVSWGLFSGANRLGSYFLVTIILLIIIFFSLHTFYEYKKNRFIGFELFVLAGALSNLLDRLLFGAVIDFIDCYAYHWHWPTFNVADAAIVIGIGGIIMKGLLWSDRVE